jgi:hypothetical protein
MVSHIALAIGLLSWYRAPFSSNWSTSTPISRPLQTSRPAAFIVSIASDDLFPVAHLQQQTVMDQHVWGDAGLAQSPRCQAQHFGTAGLARKIVERAPVRAGGDMQRPAKHALDAALEHGGLHHIGAPLPETRIGLPVSLDDGAGDQRVPI